MMRTFRDAPAPYFLRLRQGSETEWLLTTDQDRDVVGEIHWDSATAEYADGKWVYKAERQNYSDTIEVIDPQSRNVIGIWRSPWSSNSWLLLRDGSRFRWCYFFDRYRRVEDQSGSVMVRFTLPFSRGRVRIDVEAAALSSGRAEFLVLLGCYGLIWLDRSSEPPV
jgi:hypothetical protein